jgi:uncharacterized protein (DUF58 family)
MLSSRGTWFLITVVFVLVVGAFVIPFYSVVPALLGLTLLGWFLYEWVMFNIRSNAAVSRLRVSRHILQGGREVPMVWAGLAFEVRVSVENPSSVRVPFIVLEDRGAVATERVEGKTVQFAHLDAGGSIEITYTLKSPAPGILRFEGVKVRVADLNGFFYRRMFLRDPVEMLVLPPLSDDEGKQRATKRFNTLPPPGIHRLRRPGSGSELLDLRDYRAGDPPKMIAWKSSARRDKLITKEFENDVPVRAVLFLDTSEGVRLGPPGNTLLTRLAGVAAAVAQASASNRDLVGLTTFDEKESKGSSPARTKMHMINVLRRLAEVSALQPGVTGVPGEQLTRRAYPLAHELYPELMTKQANSMPLSRLWIPLLDRKWGWIVLVFIVLALVTLSSIEWAPWASRQAPWLTPVLKPMVGVSKWWTAKCAPVGSRILRFLHFPWFRWPQEFIVFLREFVVGFWVFIGTILALALPLLFWFFHGIRGWFGERRRELTQRKQLASLFALQDGSGPDAIERYIFDDEAYGVRVARFLQHHLLRCPVPLYDEQGRYRFRCPGKAPVLADAIVRSVSRARDNELYVILADISELGRDLTPVVRACRVARARHHHILVIVPWPADVPSPDVVDSAPPDVEIEEEPTRPRGKDKKKRKAKLKPRPPRLFTFVRKSLTKQYHETFKAMRRELSRVGATVMRVNDGDPVQLVLDRLDRVRGMRSRR